MDLIIIIIVILALVGIALFLLLYPLWQRTRPEAIFQVDRAGQTLEEVQARYQATLAAIKDLMFDHEMGKVSTEDYDTLLTTTKLEAAKFRQEIDRLSDTPGAHIKPTLDADIEALVAQLRHNSRSKNKSLLQEVNAEIELLKNVQDDRAGTARLTCPTCGKPVQTGDAFCSGCGQAVAGLEPQVVPEADTCPQCGYAFQPDDAFCVKCGAALTASNENIKLPSPEDATI